MDKKPLVTFIFGTRPEAIKLAPVIKVFQKSQKFKLRIILTGQHNEMVSQVMYLFDIKSDKNLNLMKKKQSLNYIVQKALTGIHTEFINNRPAIVIVQGDTSTAFSAALAAFNEKIPIAHVEAGLRSGNIYNPYPEEANRRLISQIASLHFCPTNISRRNLISVGITKNVYVTGNTVIDSLKMVSKFVNEFKKEEYDFKNKDLILATLHRRENWGKSLNDIALALKKIVDDNSSAILLIPLHRNPAVRNELKKILEGHKKIILTEPLAYDIFVSVLKECKFIITDSGGIQEEAPAFGKPVLIVRNNTERIEAIEAGSAKLIGTKKEKIYNEASILLNDKDAYKKMAQVSNPFGDGKASQKILKECLAFLGIS